MKHMSIFSKNKTQSVNCRRLLRSVFLIVPVLFLFSVFADPSGLRIISSQSSDPGPLTYGTVYANRTSGVAPLVVHFAAGFPGSHEEARGFHYFDYSWNFGDSTGGVWQTSGKSKNTAKGGVTAHVFENPGTYLATLTVRDKDGVIGTENFHINVQDPDAVYSGDRTICVNPEGDTNFLGAPLSARKIQTNELSTITQYATSGHRILLKRGASWTIGNSLNWPNNAGPVTIGAYGSGVKPSITVTGGVFFNVNKKQDWRLMDISFRSTYKNDTNINVIGGEYETQYMSILRLETEGFDTPIGWSHWNNNIIIPIDSMAIIDCFVLNAGSNGIYIGSERLVFMGNTVSNVDESHVVRVWQGYRGVVSHNILSGSSISSVSGRHALKMHGPDQSGTRLSPRSNTGDLRYRTDFVIVSDNVFGSSGPWPVVIGPQDGGKDEQLTNVIFERNRIATEYGTRSAANVQLSLLVSGRYHTIRNNILDGTGSSSGYTGISITNRGIESSPYEVDVYNNTIFQSGNYNGNGIAGIRIGSTARNIRVKNNLASFPGTGATPVVLIEDLSGVSILAGNLLASDVSFVNSDAVNPLERNFRLSSGSVGINQGVDVPVLEDYSGVPRTTGPYDVGAFEN